jgi:hypothetical protein
LKRQGKTDHSVTKRRGASFEDDLELLLGDIGRNYGICLSDGIDDLLSKPLDIEATAFAKAVVKSEGLDPEVDIEYVRAIRNDFVQRYGSDRMTAAEYP